MFGRLQILPIHLPIAVPIFARIDIDTGEPRAGAVEAFGVEKGVGVNISKGEVREVDRIGPPNRVWGVSG